MSQNSKNKKTKNKKQKSKKKNKVVIKPTLQSVVDKRINALMRQSHPTISHKDYSSTALDRFVLALYEPEVKGYGPATRPQNSFTTVHRFNTTITNVSPGTTGMATDMAILVGDFPYVAPGGTNALSQAVWEANYLTSSQSLSMLVNFHQGAGAMMGAATATFMNLGAYPALYGTAAAAATVPGDWLCNSTWAWDSKPYLYTTTSSSMQVNPRRVTGIKVTVENVTAPLYTQGSIRGGDNGTLAIDAKRIALSAAGAQGSSEQADDDIFEVPWDDVQASPYRTTFSRDPRVVEVGSIAEGKNFEFFWVPTCQEQLDFEDNPFGGSSVIVRTSNSEVLSSPPVLAMSNVVRRAPIVIIHLSGMSNLNVQSFRIRATMCVEHVVSPLGNAQLYDLSVKVPWFIPPWDKMAALPVAGVRKGKALLEAGRYLESQTESRRDPSLVRAIAADAGLIADRSVSPGVVNQNGASSAIAGGNGHTMIHAMAESHVVDTIKKAYNEVKNGGLERFISGAKGAYKAIKGAKQWAGPIVEAVEDAGPLLLM